MNGAPTRRTAINPLPWILSGSGYRLDRGVLDEAMTALARVGFTHITIELPQELTAADYAALLATHDLRAAPGYFSAPFHDRSRHAEAMEAIRRHGENHLALGVDSAFIANDMDQGRLARPAVGDAANHDRTLIIAEGMAKAADVAAFEGVRYGLHPHVGSAVEVEAEIRGILDATVGSSLLFGPDTGHLSWAGTSPETIIGDYSDRVLNIHLKDVDRAAAEKALVRGDDYVAATSEARVWIEPGRGEIDFDAVLAVLPTDFDGWFIIEVDVPHLGSAEESSAESLRFLRSHPFFTGVAS